MGFDLRGLDCRPLRRQGPEGSVIAHLSTSLPTVVLINWKDVACGCGGTRSEGEIWAQALLEMMGEGAQVCGRGAEGGEELGRAYLPEPLRFSLCNSPLLLRTACSFFQPPLLREMAPAMPRHGNQVPTPLSL